MAWRANRSTTVRKAVRAMSRFRGGVPASREMPFLPMAGPDPACAAAPGWLAALSLGAAFLTAPGAGAGECPKDQILAQHSRIERKEDVAIRRKTLEIADLSGWRGIGDLRLRMRRLTIPPGGVIPTHSHADRPSLVYFVKGETIEHSEDRKSTRLNSSHQIISYAVFCL